jgi:hypothetical protein
MSDVLVLAAVIAFFAVATLAVRGCELLLGRQALRDEERRS